MLLSSAACLTLVQKTSLKAEAQPVVQAYASQTSKLTAPIQADTSAASQPIDANVINLVDDQGNRVKPSAVLACKGDVFFLSPLSLWRCPGLANKLGHTSDALLNRIDPPKTIDGIRFQEFNNFAICPARNSIVVLDKTGDLFEYLPGSNKWQVFRANLPFFNGQPDPEFIDFSPAGGQMVLLDPERNEIWHTRGRAAKMEPCFPVSSTPWVIVPGHQYVGDGLSIACDNSIYVLKKNGVISKYNGTTSMAEPFYYKRLPNERPSRLLTSAGLPLFIVERENNRVICINKTGGQTAQFIFPAGSDLRGLMPIEKGFWIVNASTLSYRKLAAPDSLKTPLHRHVLDERVEGIVMPIKGVGIPRHVGVFPGARRLYRFGIHEGMDLFDAAGGKTRVQMGTPARAAGSGKIIRVDANFKDMDAAQFNKVMTECYKSHQTSDHNEDLLRGCQVWIDHGGGMVTRYAHLSRINPALKKGQTISRGETLGYVGVSGTGQNLPGRAKYPHLHFEIWLDGKYLGWGLTPSETMGVFEDIFGNGSE